MYFMKMLMLKLEEPLSVFQKRGLGAGFVAFVQFIGRLFYGSHEFLVFVYPVPPDVPVPSPNPDLEVRQVMAPEEFTKIEKKTEAEDIIRFYKMLELGSICLFAQRDGEVAGYTWISKTDNIDANRIQPPLEPGEALLHDLFVFPEYRRQGIAEALTNYSSNYLSNLGYIRGVCGVDVGNVKSINLLGKLGYQRKGTMVYKRFFFWRQVYKKS